MQRDRDLVDVTEARRVTGLEKAIEDTLLAMRRA